MAQGYRPETRPIRPRPPRWSPVVEAKMGKNKNSSRKLLSLDADDCFQDKLNGLVEDALERGEAELSESYFISWLGQKLAIL